MTHPTGRWIVVGVALAVLGGACSRRAVDTADDAWRDTIGRPRAGAVNLNTATRKELARLPGLTDDDAERIVRNRPYRNKRALLRKKVIGERKFDDIQSYVYVDARGED